ncbi:Type IV secretory pathway, VirD4 component, TraG/TraD family ATPase [Polaribacter sp. KT25b]|uniref:type IV secretory system conjugative DNA transfer family protein n=1 Tax=Polaribacter sp. KT25b TaxID=1855336 RepID=UPI00087A70C5|nr:type IV secretory system conjugative DNA transfer family protein [Polaribacter sp. KT25b]SDR66928.1 Type IV secretory pathway, VirD4 component, TraG/TraD family ATPase [Polaribacter sp. KT25b]
MSQRTFFDYLLNPEKVSSHGSAEFCGFWEQRKLLKPSNSGVYIANDLRLNQDSSYKNLILISPTGGGKSTRFVLNQALRKWGSNVSLIFFDPSGEIRKLSETWLIKQRFEPIYLDLTNPTNSAKHNPLLKITNKSTAKIMAESLIGVVYENSKGDQFWTQSSISILTLLILGVVLKIPVENRSLAFVNRLVNKMGHADEEINALMELALNEDDFDEYCSFMAGSQKVKQSIIATVKTALYIYSEETLTTVCSESTFSFTDLRNKRTVLYLSQEEHKMPYYKGFWNLFYRQLFESLMTESTGNAVYCFMDEFANVGAIPNFETIITTNRKKRIHLSLILQSFEQLTSVYNSKSKIIFENCNSKLFYGGLSYESSRIVSDMLGVKTESYSAKGVFKRNQPMNRISRNLMTPEEVRTQLKDDECLFIHGSYKPMKLKATAFFKNRTLKNRSKL